MIWVDHIFIPIDISGWTQVTLIFSPEKFWPNQKPRKWKKQVKLDVLFDWTIHFLQGCMDVLDMHFLNKQMHESTIHHFGSRKWPVMPS